MLTFLVNSNIFTEKTVLNLRTMPITRVPVVHKFGIISQTQRVDLEKRIAKKAYLETRRKLEAQQPPEQRCLYV